MVAESWPVFGDIRNLSASLADKKRSSVTVPFFTIESSLSLSFFSLLDKQKSESILILGDIFLLVCPIPCQLVSLRRQRTLLIRLCSSTDLGCTGRPLKDALSFQETDKMCSSVGIPESYGNIFRILLLN